ncbi:unnamed protein product [Lampetra planeri]
MPRRTRTVSAASSLDCSGVSHTSQDGAAPAQAAAATAASPVATASLVEGGEAASASSPCGSFPQNSCLAAGCTPRGASEMPVHGRLSTAMFKMAASCHVVAGGRVPVAVSSSSEDVTTPTSVSYRVPRTLLSRAVHALPSAPPHVRLAHALPSVAPLLPAPHTAGRRCAEAPSAKWLMARRPPNVVPLLHSNN